MPEPDEYPQGPGLRARAWRSAVLELAAIAGVVLVSHFIVAYHLHENTAAGAGLFLVILSLIVVLYFNTPYCFRLWSEYVRSR